MKKIFGLSKADWLVILVSGLFIPPICVSAVDYFSSAGWSISGSSYESGQTAGGVPAEERRVQTIRIMPLNWTPPKELWPLPIGQGVPGELDFSPRSMGQGQL